MTADLRAVGEMQRTAYAFWTIEGYDLLPGTAAEITFDRGRIFSTTGCNLYGTWFWIETGTDPPTLRTGTGDEWFSTLVGCGRQSPQEDWLAEFLQSGPTIERRGGSLVIAGSGITVTGRRPSFHR